MIMYVISDDQMREREKRDKMNFVIWLLISMENDKLVWLLLPGNRNEERVELEWDNGLMANESVKNIKQIITFKLYLVALLTLSTHSYNYC